MPTHIEDDLDKPTMFDRLAKKPITARIYDFFVIFSSGLTGKPQPEETDESVARTGSAPHPPHPRIQ